ncbi:MAG: sterol desaturase family protein [Winogradskyella sp.]|nr:sterol desaturase family protein [Bacteroidia bacterium]NNC45603.1 sterol desaturase family protein [Winogradskyella sp.]NNE14465.1 sterol desaturase family protein [Saprospiraceae bacterium]NNL91879.1 sterol desaturase family protein [Saprospiraceae bacterium]
MLDSIIDYFANISSLHRTIILVGGIAFFSLIESAVPLMSLNYKRWKHAGINIFFTLTTIIVNFFLAFILVKSSDWVVAHNFGIVQWLNLSTISVLIVGLLLLDFLGAWLAHWVQHHVTWMWKFHLIHHSDQNIDTTSANRHHPGESVIRFVFTIMATIVVGAPMWLVFLYQSMSVVLSQFNHANIILPSWIDKILVSVICTPNMHHVHHHYRMPYSDMNYGNIFSFWDRIFSTYTKVDNKKLNYGVDTHMNNTEVDNIGYMLKIPFLPYRNRIEYDEEEIL